RNLNLYAVRRGPRGSIHDARLQASEGIVPLLGYLINSSGRRDWTVAVAAVAWRTGGVTRCVPCIERRAHSRSSGQGDDLGCPSGHPAKRRSSYPTGEPDLHQRVAPAWSMQKMTC